MIVMLCDVYYNAISVASPVQVNKFLTGSVENTKTLLTSFFLIDDSNWLVEESEVFRNLDKALNTWP